MIINTSEARSRLSYTGHPFVDVGMAAITAFVDKLHFSEVTDADLEKVVAYIEQNYVRPPLFGHLTMAFTINAWFNQDRFNPNKPNLSGEERVARQTERETWRDAHLHQWRAASGVSETEQCVFTGQPAIGTMLAKTLPVGRAARAQVPLAQGNDNINFFPGGDPGIPVSAVALLALQFSPMGCAKCGTGLLAAHSNNERLTYEIASQFLKKNLMDVQQAQLAGDNKLPSAIRSSKTLLIETLLVAEQRRRRHDQGGQQVSLTAYSFNNGRDPSLVLYHLPFEIVSFLQVANTVTYRDAWEPLVQRAWERVATMQGKRQQAAGPPPEPRRNFLYEDLFTLFEPPQNLKRFIRRHFLRIPQRTRVEEDPQQYFDLRQETQLVSWLLVELFLRKVVHMDAERVKRICDLGDGLAEYVRSQGGRRFFRQFFTEQRADLFRGMLIKANVAHIRTGHDPLFDLNGYITVFEEGEEVMYPDWRLARDLVLIRMIDRLKDWLAQNPDAVPEIEEVSADSETVVLEPR